MSGYRALARNHDFTVLWAGETVSALGSALSMFAFPLLAWSLTRSTLLTSLAEGLFLLGNAAALLPAGVLADRLDRRRVMRFASGSGALLYGSLAVAGAGGVLTIEHVLGVAFLTGVAAGLFGPAESSAVRAVVPAEQLGTALAQNQARQHVASLLGGPLGGMLYAATRWLPFAADAVSFAVSWVTLGRLRANLSPEPRDSNPGRARDDLREGFGFLLSRPFFRVMLVFSPAANLLVNALFFVATLRLIQAGVHPAEIGLVSTAAGGAGILGALAAPWLIDRTPTGVLAVVTAWVCALAPLPLIFWSHTAAVAVCVVLVLLPNPAGNAGIGAYEAAITPQRLQGRVSAASRFLSMSTTPLAPVLGGAAMALLGGRGAIGVCVLLGVGLAVFVSASRSVRAVPRPDRWDAVQDVARLAA